ncbi:hypothetical protein VAR608DRAFT_4085 [Variovorax sp. HW608]|uniref:SLATT domain-containing protein n=1 Tax=Variovorax sp. HW608 TaxID=1034889 RepID=UPI00081F85FF|nr:SLATT domain-containing protein [Variovorax sp. HW608]SCK42609.1 hypothetical protein VAR608DRAFT_4085 [Variovorax sp. HW608]
MIGTTVSPVVTEALLKEARRIEEDAIHSAKRQFNACDFWGRLHYWLGVPATLLAAGASTAIAKSAPELAQVLGLLATLFVTLLTFLKPNDRAVQHRGVGNQYLALRSDARMFCEIDSVENKDDTKKVEALRRLAQRRTELNEIAPPTSRRAFEKAREGISQGEARYRVDEVEK